MRLEIINNSNLEKTKNILRKKDRKNKIAIKAQDYPYNKKILAYGKFDVFLDSHLKKTKNSLKKIDSNFNSYLSKLAKKNNISVGIDLKEIKNLKKRDKAEALTKIIQNIRFCRKNKVNISLIEVQDYLNAKAFLSSLGCSSQQIKQALTF